MLTCKRCGKSWTPRSSKTPKRCGLRLCRSPYWNKPRISDITASLTQLGKNRRRIGEEFKP